MVQAHYLIPEDTLCEIVSSTKAQLNSASKNYPTKASNALNVEEHSGISRHEDNYANKVWVSISMGCEICASNIL